MKYVTLNGMERFLTYLDDVTTKVIGFYVHLLHLLKLVSQTQAERLELQVGVLAT